MDIKNVGQLGVKELWSLWRDPAMLILIVYVFTVIEACLYLVCDFSGCVAHGFGGGIGGFGTD